MAACVEHILQETYSNVQTADGGWLIKKDKKGITLALDTFGDGDCRLVETIYMKQINSYLILEVIPKEKT